MRKLIVAVAASFFIAGAAQAGDEAVAAAFGNTVTLTNTQGQVSKLLMDADHSYALTVPDGTVHKGTWAINADQLCFTQTEPAPPPENAGPNCSPVGPTRAVGETWVDGEGAEAQTISIVAGR